MNFLFIALQQMGFRFSPEFVKFLVSKSDFKTHSQMSVDQFIVVCVQIQRFTGKKFDFFFSLIVISSYFLTGDVSSPRTRNMKL